MLHARSISIQEGANKFRVYKLNESKRGYASSAAAAKDLRKSRLEGLLSAGDLYYEPCFTLLGVGLAHEACSELSGSALHWLLPRKVTCRGRFANVTVSVRVRPSPDRSFLSRVLMAETMYERKETQGLRSPSCREASWIEALSGSLKLADL